MKTRSRLAYKIVAVMMVLFMASCSVNNSNDNITQLVPLEQKDKEALLFMFEEEKLARDVYVYFYDLWSITQFDNIKNSEQSHMNAVRTVLDKYNVDYVELAPGYYNNTTLQSLYDQLIARGSNSSADALQVGATIEDLDIVDLEQNIDATSNTLIISVFNSLMCGSRNHLRSFVSLIELGGGTYTPQYLTETEYESIITGDRETCNN